MIALCVVAAHCLSMPVQSVSENKVHLPKPVQPVKVMKSGAGNWMACTNIDVLGETCIEVYVITANLVRSYAVYIVQL